ncbi:hypothetical protein [Fimbriiglobus ruber]|uniref:ADP-heptose--lipooligosaccharide heptosyltransferase II n=1 Tax=Fimbriiglobus ruber TaxID=1908690 RepID=A0A225DZ53_9BACT|nr:hypothetical protein [Fimbriiglobus ruber]OWK46631.1 hypothetical protein FRUB_00330 [Fimbriiglobus ruber]
MYIEEIKKELTGRMLDIWQGKTDLPPEKAEEYRNLWRQQVRYGLEPSLVEPKKGVVPAKEVMKQGVPLSKQKPPYKLLIKNGNSPGDVLVLSAAIESLHVQFPDKYLTSVGTPCMEIWRHNPRITPGLGAHNAEVIQAEYPLINWSDSSPLHFMAAFVSDLGKKINEPLRLQVNRPFLYLSDDEKKIPDVPRPYMLVNSGTKTDYTCKGAGRKIYQEIVDHFAGKINFVQIGEAHHLHGPLERVVNRIGQTTARQLFQLAFHSVGGVGPITFLQHIYAAFQKPYVAYLGGREPLHWEHYPTQTTLTTLGQLPCCRTSSCWKSRVVPLGDGDQKDKSLCLLPVLSGDEMIPSCMDLLGSKAAIEAIERMISTGVICLGT